jgi:hypothetical protein
MAEVGAVEEFALVRLDGSASADPEGDLQEHRWSIRSVDAPCDPPEVASREPVALVRFGCAGRYEITLVVADSLNLPSDPARQEVTVATSSATSIVLAGADVAVDHRCAGRPLVCYPVDALGKPTAVPLAASAAAGVSLRWSVLPPAERPLDASRRVAFSPAPTAAAPTVAIATDGTAISGDWIFRVEARDAYGALGAAHTRVSIRNRPPIVTYVPAGPFEHLFDAQSSTFVSSGAVAWSVTDPDGDPIEEISGLWRHLGDGDAGLFDGDFDGTTVTFSVSVPYAVREDAARLRGGPGLLRQIELYAVDANRTVGSVNVPIEIGNRPPVPSGGMVDTEVPHAFDPAGSRYVAWVRAGHFVDPDGDPIVDSEAPGLCGILHAIDGDVTAECTVPFQGVPALDQLVGVRSFAAAARDPWDAASVMPYVTVTIGNRAPVLAPSTSVATKCVMRFLSGSIFRPTVTYDETPVTFTVEPHASDPDGDPMLLAAGTANRGTVKPSGEICTGADCLAFEFFEAADAHSAFVVEVLRATDHSSLSATDGVERVTTAVSPAWALETWWPDMGLGRPCP